MPSYWQKLKDPRWQKRRLEILSESEFCCQVCGDGENTLHVHHLKYDKGKEPWEYGSEWLACLCDSCHEELHEAKEILARATGGLCASDLMQVAGYAFGLSGKSFELLDKGLQKLESASSQDVAEGIYDAIRSWLPREPDAPDDYGIHVPKFFAQNGVIEKQALWSVYCSTIRRNRAQ